MNKALIPSALAVGLAVSAVAFLSNPPGAHAQAAGASRLLPLGASGQITWYLDTDKKQVVMCNAFSDNSIECRSKPMP
jgi:hypothetical protein